MGQSLSIACFENRHFDCDEGPIECLCPCHFVNRKDEGV